jgi:hypothetical protein
MSDFAMFCASCDAQPLLPLSRNESAHRGGSAGASGCAALASGKSLAT